MKNNCAHAIVAAKSSTNVTLHDRLGTSIGVRRPLHHAVFLFSFVVIRQYVVLVGRFGDGLRKPGLAPFRTRECRMLTLDGAGARKYVVVCAYRVFVRVFRRFLPRAPSRCNTSGLIFSTVQQTTLQNFRCLSAASKHVSHP